MQFVGCNVIQNTAESPARIIVRVMLVLFDCR